MFLRPRPALHASPPTPTLTPPTPPPRLLVLFREKRRQDGAVGGSVFPQNFSTLLSSSSIWSERSATPCGVKTTALSVITA